MAAVDYFLKIDGIMGESQDRAHKDQIDLIGFSWGEMHLAHPATGGGGGGGKVSMQDFHFTSHTSKASPPIFLACADGQHIPTATLTCRKAGADPLTFLVYKLGDCLVTSFSNTGPDGGSELPVDQFSMAFVKIEITFTSQNADGKAGGSVHAGWDLKANHKILP